MKAFIKALPSALFPTMIVMILALVMQIILFGNEHFEAFFGFKVDTFNPLKYGIVAIVLWLSFALLFKSDYEEV